MIDIHTHILPGMDDGSKNPEMSLEMLRMERAQGVHQVVLTPHFYRDKETPEHFLNRRQQAFDRLRQAIAESGEAFPQLALGAEVAWVPNMSEWENLAKLCMGESSYLLLEMPFYHWKTQMIDQIYDMMFDRSITPVFAHLERYLQGQPKELIRKIIEMGAPVQVSSAPMTHFMERRPILQMLRKEQAHIMASDCHNITTRPPNLAAGLAVVGKKLGDERKDQLNQNAHRLHILEDLRCDSTAIARNTAAYIG